MRRERNNKRFTPAMPPVLCGRYLIDLLYEIGPTVPTGMGSAPIGWSEIAKFCELTGIELLPWEARIVRRLSVDYAGALHETEEPWDTAERKRLTDLQIEAKKRE